MRISLIMLLLLSTAALTALTAPPAAGAAGIGQPRATAPVVVAGANVDDNDDTRVEVQLVVLGIAAGTVFVLGSGAYLLRKKLGRVAPPPAQDGAGHH